VEIGDALTIEELRDEAELIMNACLPRGHYFIAVRQYGERYSFVRRIDLDELERARFGWDSDHTIFYAIVLSRLIRDNGHSLEFAARIVDFEDGMKQVIPVIAPSYVSTYRLRRDRDWLTASEAAELQQLLADFVAIRDELPWPVIHGLNMAEDAVHLRIIQRALLLIATGLEGLVQSHSSNVAEQFRERLPRLADEVEIDGVDNAFASELYIARSEAAHGAPVSMFEVKHDTAGDRETELPHGEPDPPDAEVEPAAKLALAQDLLRATARKAVQDAGFRSIFDSKDSIAAHWPL
jgi:hypothetical protein